jgi:apolipoprotein N-acyltransferase
MAKKNSGVLNVWLLFGIAVLLLAAAWLMKSFPILIFAAIAPLFAISDQAREHSSPWNRFELILIALTIGLLAAHAFNFSTLIPVLLQAIVFTMTFVGYTFAYKSLGPRLGKFTIIFFWLGLEYLALKLPWNSTVVYLADSLLLKPNWYSWTVHTGYLGVTLWVLITNLLFYLGLFRASGFNLYYFIGAILFIALPIIYSLQVETGVITYSHMMQLYGFGTKDSLPEKYLQQGELVARTATWVSVLIILLSFVKNYTRKK